MKNPTYKVGMLVEHPSRPQWGPGKVMAIGEDRVHVIFRNEITRTAKSLVTSVVTLNVAAEQSDAILDVLPPATQDGGNWILPKNYERILKKAAAAATAAAAAGV
jgi:hypothetical protein